MFVNQILASMVLLCVPFSGTILIQFNLPNNNPLTRILTTPHRLGAFLEWYNMEHPFLNIGPNGFETIVSKETEFILKENSNLTLTDLTYDLNYNNEEAYMMKFYDNVHQYISIPAVQEQDFDYCCYLLRGLFLKSNQFDQLQKLNDQCQASPLVSYSTKTVLWFQSFSLGLIIQSKFGNIPAKLLAAIVPPITTIWGFVVWASLSFIMIVRSYGERAYLL